MKKTLISLFAAAALVPLQAAAADLITAELKPATVEAFDAYMRKAEARIEAQAHGASFLWVDSAPDRKRPVAAGRAIAEPFAGTGETEIAGGLIHDWIGAVFIAGATLDRVLAFVEDYDNHKNFYKPEVVDSKTVSHSGDQYAVFLRLLKKKVLTVTLDTNHDVRYFRVDAKRAYSRSYSTRVAEVENAGAPGERELPPGKDHGFLWRLDSFWRFEERDGGVYVECEAISLTRNVPAGLGWLIEPIIRSLPRESLEATLAETRQGLSGTSRGK